MDKDKAYAIAQQAVENLVDESGPNVNFPFDQIWQFADAKVPSTQRPAIAKKLKKDGYLEPTGGMAKAVTEDRAGSTTTEYRPGPRFQPEQPTSTRIASAIEELEKAMDSRGLMITSAEIANFYLAMMTTPIAILAGLSGTGKSWIPRLFARLTDADFTPISVQPQWSDNTDLFGYTPSLAPSTFIEGRFTRALRKATKSTDELFIVLLDEMNLAVVEHYFSDFLSVAETRRRQGNTIITDPLPLDLPLPGEDDAYADLRRLYLPLNIRVVGTANMDETTRIFSPKVIDRAFIIEFDDIDLTSFPTYTEEEIDESYLPILAERLVDPSNPTSLGEVYSDASQYFTWIAGLLEEIRQILRPAGISFGYRSRDDILLYMWHWQNDSLARILSADAAFDLCVLQKILPKIAGTGEALLQALGNLADWLNETRRSTETPDSSEFTEIPLGSFERSAAKVGRMLRRLEIEGVTTYWGT